MLLCFLNTVEHARNLRVEREGQAIRKRDPNKHKCKLLTPLAIRTVEIKA